MRVKQFGGIILCSLVLAACNPVADVQRYVRGQQLKHADVMPARAGEYITAAGLSTTTIITFADPASGQTRTITDRPTIGRVLSLLAAGKPRTAVTEAKPEQPVKLSFTLDPPDRVVTMMYLPDQDTVSLYNIPTVPWPQHYVGSYGVAADFGAALLATLNQPQE